MHSLITVSVAVWAVVDGNAAQGVHDAADRDVGVDTGNGDDGVHGERDAEVVVTVDGGGAGGISVLPDAESVVDERVVHPEDGVAGAGRDVRHDGTDTVVAIGVGSALSAALHACVVGTRVASVDESRVALSSQALVDISAQTMGGGGARSGTNVAGQTGEGSVCDTLGTSAGQRTEVCGAEDVAASEVTGVESLVPPWEGVVEGADIAELHLEDPEEVAMPDQELGVSVDVDHPHLMQPNEILISARGRRELSGGGLALQALDGVHEVDAGGGRV